MPKIHPTSIMGPEVKLADTVEVGPFCVLTGQVEVGAGTKLLSHVVIGDERTKTVIGENTFHSGAVVGGAPQDLYKKAKERNCASATCHDSRIRHREHRHAQGREYYPHRFRQLAYGLCSYRSRLPDWKPRGHRQLLSVCRTRRGSRSC